MAGEDGNTYQWSFDGSYIAKITKKEIIVEKEEKEPVKDEEGTIIPEEEEEPKFKTFITVYELPSMKMIEDMDKNRTSISIEGLREFAFIEGKNIIIATSFPEGENQMPRVSAIEIPSRRSLLIHAMKDSKDLKLYVHPQGMYFACMNQFMQKKTERYSVELFEMKNPFQGIPHQQIVIDREVNDFHSIVFEPNQSKISILCNVKKVLKRGEMNFSNDPNINIADFYQIKSDALLGFTVKPMGMPQTHKIVWAAFSCVGNIFASVEKESPTKQSLNFYMISKISNEGYIANSGIQKTT